MSETVNTTTETCDDDRRTAIAGNRPAVIGALYDIESEPNAHVGISTRKQIQTYFHGHVLGHSYTSGLYVLHFLTSNPETPVFVLR